MPVNWTLTYLRVECPRLIGIPQGSSEALVQQCPNRLFVQEQHLAARSIDVYTCSAAIDTHRRGGWLC